MANYLTDNEKAVLQALNDTPDAPLRDIAKRLGLEDRQITKAINKLLYLGMIEKVPPR